MVDGAVSFYSKLQGRVSGMATGREDEIAVLALSDICVGKKMRRNVPQVVFRVWVMPITVAYKKIVDASP